MNKRTVGLFYEKEAVQHLECLGYRLITQNYWTDSGEIDLVLIKDQTLYFVEVKYRSSDAFGSPRQAITYKKKINMKKSAMHYLKANHGDYQSFSISFMGITREANRLKFDFIENIFD